MYSFHFTHPVLLLFFPSPNNGLGAKKKGHHARKGLSLLAATESYPSRFAHRLIICNPYPAVKILSKTRYRTATLPAFHRNQVVIIARE
jgi:hypothetical protein